jgi:HAD superfamily hydrolase (TIGR01484 family)
MGVKLVALDIDGTILSPGAPPGAEPSPRLRAAVKDLQRSGVVVVLASGRMFPGTAEIARHLGVRAPVICQQGCSVHLLDGTMTHLFPIDRKAALEICAYAREIDRPYEWFNPLRYIASRQTVETEDYGRVSGITPEYRPDPENSGVVPTGSGVISSFDEAARIHRELVARFGESLHVLDFPAVTVAVAPNANKGHALSLICADLNIDRQETLAIGDSVNDAPMLAWAGRSIAMPHSDRYALEAAHEVLADDSVDALAALLETLVR